MPLGTLQCRAPKVQEKNRAQDTVNSDTWGHTPAAHCQGTRNKDRAMWNLAPHLSDRQSRLVIGQLWGPWGWGQTPVCRGAGAGGGPRGAIAPPPNFLSQWDGYACAPPPKIWQSLGISTLLPPAPLPVCNEAALELRLE